MNFGATAAFGASEIQGYRNPNIDRRGPMRQNG